MIGGAVVGGIILAMIEGVSLGLSRMSGQMQLNEQSKIWKLSFLFTIIIIYKLVNFLKVEQARAANGTNWFFFWISILNIFIYIFVT